MRLLRSFGVGLVALSSVLTAAAPCSAEVRLPKVFGDHMVLQRDMPIAVWGRAEPGEKVSVLLASDLELGSDAPWDPTVRTAEATADAQGRWSVQLVAAQPEKRPSVLRVCGKNEIVLRDILIGDVWFCSGQSNMYWPVSKSADAKAEIAAGDWPKIRSFEVWKDASGEPRDDVYGQWRVCSPETVGSFSAVAYYFARHLHKKTGVPMGLIHSSWAATSAHPWMSWPGLTGDAELKRFAENLRERTADNLTAFRAEWEPKWAAWAKAAAAARAAGKPEPGRPAVSFRNKVRSAPSVLYNGMIAPLVRYRVKGAIWYQGENDVHRGAFYQRIFEALIRDWRRQWKQADLPFLFVQLASYKARKAEPGDSTWAALRQAQAGALRLPKTGMACTIDIGDAENIHPPNKQDVGLRLALAALKVAYGRDVVWSGPVLKAMTVEGNGAVLSFDHVGGGLVVRGGGALKGFAVAGADRAFVWAKARIEGDKVLVSGEGVAKVVAVRYAWADNPACNLANTEGLPAVPFRTDHW